MLKFKLVFIPLFFIALVVALLSSMVLLTPANFQNPKLDHSHFRMQYIFMGQAEDFGSPRYQIDYLKDVCSGALSESPIHFHDNKNQFVHLHWQKVTGGEVLKFYGLNRIGGLNDFMGVKIDNLLKFKFTPIPIHSKSLPQPRPNDKFWVYSGDKGNYQKRTIEDFTNQDLETFFGKESQLRKDLEKNQTSNLDLFGSIKVQAHSGEQHANATEAELHLQNEVKAAKEKAEIETKNLSNKISQSQADRELTTTTLSTPSQSSAAVADLALTEEELKDLNNLIGNVVIFVQPDEPSSEQINLRFNNLEPLSKSVCGG